MTASYVTDVLVVLVAAIAVVPLLHRLRVSPILGYFAAGLAIGPYGFKAVSETSEIEVFAEFGVVFLMFAIGLDLTVPRLKSMHRAIFGLGLAQVAVTGLALGLAAWALGYQPAAAVVIGGALAMSSTATVLQLLMERGEAAARFGRLAVGVLLFQDLAVVPLVALVPLLASRQGELGVALGMAAAKAVVALAVILVVGRYVVGPLFRLIAGTRNTELFTATSLFVLLGTGWATAQAGMSMALGAFLAGILLAGTPYRHQVEAEIQPFRALLLGLFFMAVGMTVEVPFVIGHLGQVIGLGAGLLAVKAVLLGGLVLAFGHSRATAARIGLLLAQGGEFAFVVLGLAAREAVLPEATVQVLTAAVVLSLCAAPLLAGLGRTASDLLRRRDGGSAAKLGQEVEGLSGHVVVAGYGRVGQTICRILEAQGLAYVALDMDVQRVLHARDDGRPVYFGDASRLDVLRAAGTARAGLAVVTLDNAAAAERTVAALHSLLGDLPVVARARDRRHGRRLEQAGASEAVAEAIEGSLTLSERALILAGQSTEQAAEAVAAFRVHDYALLDAVLGGIEERDKRLAHQRARK